MKKVYIEKDAFVAKIEDWRDKIKKGIFSIPLTGSDRANATFEYEILGKVKDLIDTFEVREVDIDKLCEFRKNIGFAYPEGASEYQKQLACYRQGVKDTIKAQKGE